MTPHHLQASCPYCDAAITVHQKFRPGHCGAPSCHKAHVLKGDALRLAAWLAQYQDRVAIAKRDMSSELAQMAQTQGIAPDKVHIGSVPHAKGNPIPLPDDARAAYLTHLHHITELAFQQPLPDAPSADRDTNAERAEPHPWNNTACGTCQGYCCQKWGRETHAFQSVDSILELRQSQPDLTQDAVIALYTNALPEVSAEDGCVFQGPMGCVLQRDQRANICNVFRCYALRRLAEDVDPKESDAVAVVSFDGDTPGRTGLYAMKSDPDTGKANPRPAEA